jgi:hypothetical protein
MQIKAWLENDRIRTEGSAAIVDAAIEAGVSRVVQESVSVLYRDRGDEWIDEDSPIDDFPMARANHAAEAARFASCPRAVWASCCDSVGSTDRAPRIAKSS